MGGAASVPQKNVFAAKTNRQNSIVVEIVRVNNLSECFGTQRPKKQGCNAYIKFWLTSGDDLENVKGVKTQTLARVNAFEPVFRSYRCLYSPAEPNDVLHFEVWDTSISSRPLAQVRVMMAETTSGFVLIKKLNLLHPNPLKLSDPVNDAEETYRVTSNQISRLYRFSPAQDANISFRVLFPHKAKGWRRRRTLFLIRHGESKWNAAVSQKDLAALMHFDHPLTIRGITQARKLEETWTSELAKQKVPLTPMTPSQLKDIDESDFVPVPVPAEKPSYQLPGRPSRANSLEDSDSGEDSEDNAPVREQQRAVLGTTHHSVDTSNPNAVSEAISVDSNCTKALTSRDATTPSSVSAPSSSSTQLKAPDANPTPAMKRATNDNANAHGGSLTEEGIPMTQLSFQQHVESKIVERDTKQMEKQQLVSRKKRVIIKKNISGPKMTAYHKEADLEESGTQQQNTQQIASSIGLSINNNDRAKSKGSSFQTTARTLVGTRQRRPSFSTEIVLTPKTGHSQHTSSPSPRASDVAFDFEVTDSIRAQRQFANRPEAFTLSFTDSLLRFYGASAVFSSPLTRATQTALLSLASHPVLCNTGLTLLGSLREKKTQGGFDSVGKEVGHGIYQRTEKELAATLIAQNRSKDAPSIGRNNALPVLDPAEQARRAMRKMDPYDSVTQWWIPVSQKDTKESFQNRISDFLCTMEFYPTAGAIVVVGHSLFIRTFFQTYIADSLMQEMPQMAHDMCQTKLQNAGCIRVDLDFCKASTGGSMAIVNAELMFGSSFERKKKKHAATVTQYKVSTEGPPSQLTIAENGLSKKKTAVQLSRRLSPIQHTETKFASRKLQAPLDNFSLSKSALHNSSAEQPELVTTV